MDKISAEKRSYVMSRIRSKDTGPEMAVRRWLHSRGFRYRLHDKRLPGKPDVVFPGEMLAVHINGCFWHAHRTCFKPPKSNTEFWGKKIEANVARDARNLSEMGALGWTVVTIWECEVNRDLDSAMSLVAAALAELKQIKRKRA